MLTLSSLQRIGRRRFGTIIIHLNLFQKVHGSWSAWPGWSSCTATCGGGTKSRTRSCTNPKPVNGGSNCSGPLTGSTSCSIKICPGNKLLTLQRLVCSFTNLNYSHNQSLQRVLKINCYRKKQHIEDFNDILI